MSGRSRILFREMIFDLHYRLRLADEVFCAAAESLVAAAALEEGAVRGEVIRRINGYSAVLQLINVDFCRIIAGRNAVFPAELSEWIFDEADGEAKAGLQLERLHAIAGGLELAVNRELLQLELPRE